NRGARVTRHLDLRDNLDVARRGVAHNLDVVGVGEEPAAPRPIHLRTRAKGRLQKLLRVERVTASGADRRQRGEAGDLDSPSFVIREVDVKDVELVARE